MNFSALHVFDLIAKAFVGGGFILIGLSCLYMFVKFFMKSKSSLRWKHTQGKILISEYYPSADNPPELDYKIMYTYTVNDIDYTGNRIYFRTMDGDSTNHMKKYKVGKEVLVYYNPKNLKESVLETGLHYNLYSLIIMGLFTLIVGILIIMYA